MKWLQIKSSRDTEGQKNNRFRLAKQQFCMCIQLFVLCHHCMTMTWNCLISRFVEDENTRQQLSFSFPELRYSPLEFSPKKVCQHLTFWKRWNKHIKVWSRRQCKFNSKWTFSQPLPSLVLKLPSNLLLHLTVWK